MGTNPQHSANYGKLRKLLWQWRAEVGLTQRELGRRLKRPHTFVHKTETGDRRIDPIEFVRWCRACDQDPARCITKVTDRKRS